MNLEAHSKKLVNFFQNLFFGEEEDAERFRAFYDEYMAVLDMPAEFYIETIDRIFRKNELANGTITYKGQKVDFSAIKNTALLTVEGANDDICGIGQTQAAHDICPSIPAKLRAHHLQEGAGHYGIFSGSKFRKSIRPLISSFIRETQLNPGQSQPFGCKATFFVDLKQKAHIYSPTYFAAWQHF